MAYIFRRDRSPFWWVGYVRNGRRVQKSLKVTSKDAAKTLLAEYLTIEARDVNRSTLLIIPRQLSELTDEFLERTKVGKAKETIREKEGAMKRFKAFYAGRMEDLTPSIIEAHHHARAGSSIAGANKDLKVIKTLLNYAVARGYLRDNPARSIKKIKTVKKIFRNLSFDETGNLLMVAMHVPRHKRLYPIIAAAYYLGLRKNELVFLEWGDVDLERNMIRVVSKPENRIKDCEERNLPINGKLREILVRLPRTSRYVFPTPSGRPWKNNLHREVMLLATEAGIPGLNMQTLRETFGSHLLRRHVSVYLVSKFLGHSSVDVTTRHYAHVPIEETHAEIDRL